MLKKENIAVLLVRGSECIEHPYKMEKYKDIHSFAKSCAMGFTFGPQLYIDTKTLLE